MDVFFSYCGKDSQAAKHYSDALQAAGISVWLDPRGPEAPTVWTQEIVQAIEDCSVMIVLLSRTSVNSHNVVKEVSLASERGKAIVPVKLEPVDIPSTMQYPLGHLTSVELYEAVNLQQADPQKLEALLQALAGHGLSVSAPPEPEVAPAPSPIEESEPPPAPAVESGTPSRKGWRQKLKQVQANVTRKTKLAWLAILFYARKAWRWYRAQNQKTQIVVGAAVGVVVVLLVLWIGWPTGKAGTGYSAPPLSESQLHLAAQRVNVRYQKGGFSALEGEKEVFAAAGVYRKRSGKLYMVAGAKVTNLPQIVAAEKSPPVKIKSYSLWSLAASHVHRQVERFALKPGGLDLAVLEVNANGMKAGTDYLLLPYRPGADMDEGDEVVLLHWIPAAGDGTRQTPETISRRREIQTSDGKKISAYRVGAGIKSGLVVKKSGDVYYWVGVVAYHEGGASFAISPTDFLKLNVKFYQANRDGAAQAIRDVLKYEAVGQD